MSILSTPEQQRRGELLADPAATVRRRLRIGAVTTAVGLLVAGVVLLPGMPISEAGVGALLAIGGATAGGGALLWGVAHTSAPAAGRLAVLDAPPASATESWSVRIVPPAAVDAVRPGEGPGRVLWLTSGPTTGRILSAHNLGGAFAFPTLSATVRVRAGVDDGDGSPIRWYAGPLTTAADLPAQGSSGGAGVATPRTAVLREEAGALAWVVEDGGVRVGVAAAPPSLAEWRAPVQVLPWWWHLLWFAAVLGLAGATGPFLAAGMVAFVVGAGVLGLGVGRLGHRLGWPSLDPEGLLLRRPVRSVTARVPGLAWAGAAVLLLLALGTVPEGSTAQLALSLVWVATLLECAAAVWRRVAEGRDDSGGDGDAG